MIYSYPVSIRIEIHLLQIEKDKKMLTYDTI